MKTDRKFDCETCLHRDFCKHVDAYTQMAKSIDEKYSKFDDSYSYMLINVYCEGFVLNTGRSYFVPVKN